MQFRFVFSFVFALTLAATPLAADIKAGGLHVEHARARTTVSNQTTGAAYLTIENKNKGGDRLLSAASPIAKSVEIHAMSMDGNVMRMREVPNFEIKPSEKIVMQPGDGYHVMLIGLKQQLKAGETFPLTLQFQKSGKIQVSVQVEDMNPK